MGRSSRRRASRSSGSQVSTPLTGETRAPAGGRAAPSLEVLDHPDRTGARLSEPSTGGGGHTNRRQRQDGPAREEDELQQGLSASCWFDSGPGDRPYSATVRFTGRRLGATGRLRPKDGFVRDEVVAGIIPGTGPVSITTRVQDVNPGQWSVSAEMLPGATNPRAARQAARLGPRGSRPVFPATWSWRHWSLAAGPAEPIRTRWAPLTDFIRMPAVIPASWGSLVLAGVIVGMTVQGILASRYHLNPARILTVSIIASLAGLAGAKAWYVALNLRGWRAALRVGLCIQGFLVGAVVVGLALMMLLRLPIGPLLDATAPGLFFGVMIGRLGCFFTGCCAGRLSASRWAIWSSDRRVGARRIPTQLLESLAGLVIGTLSTLAVLYSRPGFPGAIFVAACAAYTLVRQGLLRLRGEERRSSLGGPLTAAASAVVMLVSVASVVVGFPRSGL